VHGRVLQWSLTRRGLTLLAKCRRPATALERRLAAGLNRKQERAVRRWLSNIALTLQT
jgi:DNA-binding MarR family transcriptional regulator